MKRNFSTKVAIFAVLTMFAMNLYAFAGDSYEAKIKTDVRDAVGKNKIETITNFLKGVEDATLHLEDKGLLIVKYDSEMTNADMIVHVLTLMGYDAELEGEPINISKDDSKADNSLN